jgi:hypothetical protein
MANTKAQLESQKWELLHNAAVEDVQQTILEAWMKDPVVKKVLPILKAEVFAEVASHAVVRMLSDATLEMFKKEKRDARERNRRYQDRYRQTKHGGAIN